MKLPHFVAKIEYSLKRNTICHRKKLPVKERNFLSQEETKCHKKKPPITVRNFLSHEKALKIDIQMDKLRKRCFICNTYKIIKNAMNNHWKENSERNTICHRKKLPVTERNFLSQEETYSQGKKLNVTGRNLLSQEETSCHSKKHLKIDIQMDDHNAE